jgi:fructose-specific phosphotransferase system component IIB
MNFTTFIYYVLISVLLSPWLPVFGQSVDSTPGQQSPGQEIGTTGARRTVDPESIKRAKLTRLKHDIALSEEQAEKVKPLIDTYVNAVQAIKTNAALDSRAKRQKVAEARQRYDSDLNGVLSPEQQQKLASLKEERRERLRRARVARSDSSSAQSAPNAAPSAQ